jgi:MtfA peptidase
MFAWWRERQRQQILELPFAEPWRAIIERNVGYAALLSGAERAQLEKLVQVFLAEKNLEGCGGLELTDEIRVTVAANACILLLGLSHDLYRHVDSILIYPSAVVPPERRPGFFELPTRALEAVSPLTGQAHRGGGPVILVWDEAKRGSRDPRNGHNVVFHEFAHKLDMLDGRIDGTPPLRGSPQLCEWAEVCSRAYHELQADTDRGKQSFMDAYGATSEAEFFAVATETFFERPALLQQEQLELYEVLRGFYRQDPAARMGDT